MTRDEFVAARSERWSRLERLLDDPASARDGEALRQLATLYRALCADVMQVRSLGFGPDLRRRLDTLASRSNNLLYRAPARTNAGRLSSLVAEFPRGLRRAWPFALVAALLFWVPFAVGLAGALGDRHFAERVLPAETLDQLSASYSKGFAAGRASAEDAAMTGFYVQNNIGISFRCFASGVLFGAGSAFFLIYNGLDIGTVVGFLMQSGHGRNILTFVCGHSPFELGAVIISGAAGLMLGYALIDTGGLPRLSALRRAGRAALPLVAGATLLLVAAALVEGFWSASSAPDPIKWLVAAFNTLLTAGIITGGGRGGLRRA